MGAGLLNSSPIATRPSREPRVRPIATEVDSSALNLWARLKSRTRNLIVGGLAAGAVALTVVALANSGNGESQLSALDRSRIVEIARAVSDGLSVQQSAALEAVIADIAADSLGRRAELRDGYEISLLPDRAEWRTFEARTLTDPPPIMVVVRPLPAQRGHTYTVVLIQQPGWIIKCTLTDAELERRVPWLADGIGFGRKIDRIQ